MGYQVPRDMIEQARILLRKEAGFESYHPSVPSLPVEDVIAGIDPSPDSVRCIQCKGNLLRGSQSLICVYCGRQLHREILPDPISFKSTIGFRWLIESLSLDGSEIVEPSEEDRQMNRGRNSGKDEISLSDFLNLDMTWPAESERFGLTDADEFRIQRSRQLAGMSLILTSSENKSEEAERSIAFQAIAAPGNHHLSENQEFFGVKTSEVKHDDSFSVWEADFAAAAPVAPHDYAESPHPLNIPSVDYNSHIDSVFEPVKDVEEGKPKHDPFSNVQHHVTVVPDHGAVLDPDDLQIGRQQDEGLESDDSKMGVQHADSKSVTDMTNDQGLTSSSISVWNEFGSSTGLGFNQHQTSCISAPMEDGSFDAWNDFTSADIVSDGQLASRGMKSAEEKSVIVNNDMFGSWNDVIILNNTQEKKDSGEIEQSTETDKHNDSVVLSSDNSSLSDMGDKLPDTIVDSTVDTINKKHEDPFELFGKFMGSTVPQPDHGETNNMKLAGGHLNTEADTRVDGWDDFMRLTKSSISEKNSKETHGDTKIDKDIDSWNAFNGSASRPENKSSNEDMAWVWTDISNQNIQQEGIDHRTSEHKAVIQDENSPTSWFDFSASGNIVSNKDQTSSSFSNVASADFPNQLFEDFPSSMGIGGEEHSRMEEFETNEVKVDDVLNSWMGFTNSSGLPNNQCQDNEAQMSEDLSMGLDSIPAIMKTNENHDSSDGWSDFKSSTNLPGNELRNESQINDKHAVVRDGPYDAWDLLTSSSGSQRNVAAAEDVNQVSLFDSPYNMKSDSFNSTLHPVIFPDMTNDHLSENQEFFGVKPSEVKHDSFSVWEADFAAAPPVAPHDYTESPHPLNIPSVDYNSHIDSVFEPVKDVEERKPKHDPFSNVQHHVTVVPDHGAKVLDPEDLQLGRQQDEVLESDDSKMGFQHADSKSVTDMTNDQGLTSSSSSISVWNEFGSSTGLGFNQHQTSCIGAPMEDGSFDAWNDFTSADIVSDGQLASRGMKSAEEKSVIVDNDMFGSWNDVNLNNTQEKKDSGEIVQSTETDKHNDSVVLSSDNSSLSDMGDKLPDTIVDSTVDTINKKHEDPFELFGKFMGSTVPQPDHGETNNMKLAGGHLNTEADTRVDGWDDFMRLTKSSISEKNSKETHGDTKIDKDIDSWNAFNGSASRPENKSSNEDMAWVWTDISNQNIQQEGIDHRASEHKAVIQDENSPTSWFDFSASGNIVSNKDQTSSSFSNVASADFPNQLFEDFPSCNEVKVDDVLNSWMGFTNSSGLLNNQCQTNEAQMSEDLSMGLDSVPAIMKNNGNDDSFDGWSDFKSSTNLPGNEFRNESQVDDKHAVVRDGPYDAWNLLTSSSGSQRNVAADEDVNQVRLFASPYNIKSDTLHPVIFAAAASNQNETANIDISSSDSFRLEDGNARSSIHTEQIGKVEDVANRKAINAEALISQMQERDISFMLESNLSVPKK